MGVLANPDSNQAMVPSKQKRTHAVFCVSSAHRLAPTSKPRFVGEKVKLGDVCDVLNGFAFKSRQYVDKGIRIIRIANVQKGYLEDSKPCFYPVKLTDSLKQYILEENDLLVSLTGNVGRVALLEKSFLPAALNQRVACLRIKDESRICKRYLYHALNSSLFENNCVESANGIAQKNMSTTWLKGYRIPAPSMVEQEIIIKQLDLIQRQISNVKRQLSEFDSLVKSRFVEMFESKDYGMRPMGDLVESITAGTNVGGQQRPLGEGEYGVLKISAVTQGVFNPGEFKVVNDVSHIKMIHPRKGDLLFSRANTSEMVGATAIVDKDYGDLFLPDKLWRLDPTDEVETVFLKALLSSPSIRAEMSKVSTGSSGSMQNISMAKFRKLPAFLPPLALQQEFAAFASQVDKSRFVRDHEMNFR